VVIKQKINSTLFQDWEPVYIGEEKIKQDDRFSWMSSSSTDVPDYKLTYKSNSKKVHINGIFVFKKTHHNNHGPEHIPLFSYNALFS
jgi:hypothetical protein